LGPVQGSRYLCAYESWWLVLTGAYLAEAKMQRSIILGGIVAAGCAVALACGSDDEQQIMTPPAGDASMEAAADDSSTGGGSGGTAGRGGSGGVGATGGIAGGAGVAGAGGTPPATCTPVELVCDGAEDCPGQICCGRVDLAGGAPTYVEFACQDTCEFTMMGGWVELCHDGDTCANMEMCQQTVVLPTSLSRCLTMNGIGAPRTDVSTAADEVNCGDTVCAAGEKCCLRQPDVPYCAPEAEPCACMPGGGGEAGVPPAEAGATDAGGPTRGGGNRDGGNQGGGQRDR
jgi:hypothetical protein